MKRGIKPLSIPPADQLEGTLSHVATKFDVSITTAAKWKVHHGIPAASRGRPLREVPPAEELQGGLKFLAKKLGVSYVTVWQWKKIRGVPSHGTGIPLDPDTGMPLRPRSPWSDITPEEWAASNNKVIAAKIGVTHQAVSHMRRKLAPESMGVRRAKP